MENRLRRAVLGTTLALGGLVLVSKSPLGHYLLIGAISTIVGVVMLKRALMTPTPAAVPERGNLGCIIAGAIALVVLLTLLYGLLQKQASLGY